VKLGVATVALALAAVPVAAQTPVVIDDIGPGRGGRLLQEVLRRPHRLAEPDTTLVVITREVEVRGSLVVLARSVRIDGTVDGDVVVVGGDLFVRPGAHVRGRAIAIGGGAYPSALAKIDGEVMTFRDGTYDVEKTSSSYRLTYRSLEEPPLSPLLFPLFYGVRAPAYDRVNGLSVPFGPAFQFARERALANVLVTWRSDIGAVDPSATLRLQLTRRSRLSLDAGRGSFSNDKWIWRDLVHSFFVLTFAEDNRNWFRADRLEFLAHRLLEGAEVTWEPFAGVLWERAWSVGPGAAPTSGPWSLFGTRDSIGMRRPNPPVADGHLTSILAGTTVSWDSDGLRLAGRTRVEAAVATPTSASFQQVTSDLAISFPTFGEQGYAVDVHWVTTLGDTPPPQRYAFAGGSGTLPFIDMLAQGGDELLLIDQRYSVQLTGVTLGAFGSPALQLRHRLGAAGAGSLPTFEQMLGVGLSLTVIRGEVQLDPASQRWRATAGFTFSR